MSEYAQFYPIGLNSWIEDQITCLNLNPDSLARIISVHRDNYTVRTAQSEVQAELTGKLLYQSDSPLDLPCVGDWVVVELFDENSFAIIHQILPRKSLLKRKTSGKKIDFQPIASNIDYAFIMQSFDANFNPNRLDRYLVMVQENSIEPIVLLSKRDLISDEDVAKKVLSLQKNREALKIIPFSNEIISDYKEVESVLKKGKTYCLLGSSGVGKTTLLNNLLMNDVYQTNAVREGDHKGRHTTTRRELIQLESGALIIDTPGMRELGLFDLNEGLNATFNEIVTLSKKCKYSNCTHIHEEGCAVLEALELGELDQDRYDNYIKIKKEADHYAMSYQDKRKKDKAFGKMVKNAMKHHKNKR